MLDQGSNKNQPKVLEDGYTIDPLEANKFASMKSICCFQF